MNTKSWHVMITLAVQILLCGNVLGSAVFAQGADPGANSFSSLHKPDAVSVPDASDYTMYYIGSTFKPLTSGIDYAVDGDGSCVWVTGGDPNVRWILPLDTLPRNALVTRIRFFYNDKLEYEATAGLTRYGRNHAGKAGEWSVQSTGMDGYGITNLILNPPIPLEYQSYSYALWWLPFMRTSWNQFCGIEVWYRLPAAAYLPAVIRGH